MTRILPMVVRVAALALALGSGWLFFAFGRAVEPQPAIARDVVAAILFGLAAHLGLFLSADAASRPPWFRRLAFLLMLPTSVVLFGSTLETGRRIGAGSSPSAVVLLAYGAGLMIYIVQLVAMLRAGLGRSRRATAA